jgi:hypothetical protein
MTLNLTDLEMDALGRLSAQKDLTKTAVLRQALRLYQLVEARLCALKALFTRWPDLALAIDPGQICWRKRPGLRAIEKLPVLSH